MPDKAKPDDPAQSRRFVEIAREVEAIDDDSNFLKTFEKITLIKPERQNTVKEDD